MKVLLASIAFQPKRDSESLQTAKYFKYLNMHEDVSCQVVTSDESGTIRSLFRRRVRKSPSGVISVSLFQNRYLNFILNRFFQRLITYPDMKWSFSRKWRLAVSEISKKPDIILSRTYPISSALMGHRLATAFNVPWILQLSDPWTLMLFRPKRYAMTWNKRWESICFESAARITFTSMLTLEKYEQLYPMYSAKFRYFPNVFDPEDAQPNPWVRRDKVRIVHSGSLPNVRSPVGFIEALKAFHAIHPEKCADFEVTFVGDASREIKALFVKHSDLVSFGGVVPFEQSIQLQRSADVLLLIDYQLSTEARARGEKFEFFPSKLLDYLIAERRILALTENGSIAANIIQEMLLGNSLRSDETDAQVEVLLAIWQAWKNDDGDFFRKTTSPEFYSAKRNADRLIAEMREVLSEK